MHHISLKSSFRQNSIPFFCSANYASSIVYILPVHACTKIIVSTFHHTSLAIIQKRVCSYYVQSFLCLYDRTIISKKFCEAPHLQNKPPFKQGCFFFQAEYIILLAQQLHVHILQCLTHKVPMQQNQPVKVGISLYTGPSGQTVF